MMVMAAEKPKRFRLQPGNAFRFARDAHRDLRQEPRRNVVVALDVVILPKLPASQAAIRYI